MIPNSIPATLALEDGTVFAGFSFGAETSAGGEVVFNTATTYPELLADPMMAGHIVVMTYPLVGNYGVPPVEELETPSVQAAGLVVTDYSEQFSHWNAARSLGAWLKECGVPAIRGVDTRQLAKHLREHGEMRGRIIVDGGQEVKSEKLRVKSLTGTFGEGDITVCALGEGLRRSIVASLNRRGAKVVQAQNGGLDGLGGLSAAEIDGYLVTGTVDEAPEELIAQVRAALASGKPVFGVCGGDLPIALAAGASIEKLSHPHRGINQPVIERGTPHSMITTQNHAWAVAAGSLPDDWEVWMENLNDGSVEGIRRRDGLAKAVQFHPEATLRPAQADSLYDNFVEQCKK